MGKSGLGQVNYVAPLPPAWLLLTLGHITLTIDCEVPGLTAAPLRKAAAISVT